MSLLDGIDVFGSGPHAIRPGPWQRDLQRRGFAGLDGEVLLDLGLRSRTLQQTGRLQAATAEALEAIIAQIQALQDGKMHVLVDNHGQSLPAVVVEQFELTTPVQAGRGFWCEYTLRYRQLP